MPKVYCVYLRRPHNKRDKRTDPKYESGNFGSTGCHSDNLLSDAGQRQNRIQKGDRLMFVQGSKVVFITPPLARLDRTDGYNVAVWNSRWESKERRPLKLKYGMKLDLDHFRMINPKIRNLKKISSYLRTYSQPIENSYRFLRYYESFLKKQEAEYGDKIHVEHYCQTFCENEECEGCTWLTEAKSREESCPLSSGRTS
jgi:hypothetical protein